MVTKNETPAELTTTEAKPGYIFALQADLGNGRQLTVTGNLPIAATRQDFDTELDKICGAVERKQDEATIPALEDAIEKDVAELASHRKNIEAINAEYADKKGQDVQHARALQPATAAVDAVSQRIEARTKLVEKLKSKI